MPSYLLGCFASSVTNQVVPFSRKERHLLAESGYGEKDINCSVLAMSAWNENKPRTAE